MVNHPASRSQADRGRTDRRLRAVLCALLGFALVPFAAALEPGIATPAGYRDDRILVLPAPAARGNPAWQRLHAELGTAPGETFSHARGGTVVKLPRGLTVAAALAAFQRSGLVEYAEPDYLLRALVAPNDFQYQNKDQWNLHNTGVYGGLPGADIMAEAGWDLQREAPDIVVAILDTGIRYTHEDLAPNMWVNPGETGVDARGRNKRSNGVDDDGNGWVDDVHGINVLARNGNPLDDWGHGTHVAGIVGAATNNSVGVAGVAWRVKLMAVRFIDANSNYSISDAITALDYARRQGARIVTASWGNYAFNSTAFRDAMAAMRAAGIIVAAAAGNDNNDNDQMPLYPASYDFDNIVAVAATTRVDGRAGYSNYGARSVDLGAPGSPVFSTWAGTDRDYRYYEGTSMAAPHIAGACALLWARFPGDSYQQIIQRVLSTVDPLPELTGRTVTNGRLNLAAALASGSSSTPPPPSDPIPPPSDPTPPPSTGWTSSDIGAVAASGSTAESGGTITVNGSGADIWDSADEFHYRYQSLTGDGEIVARVTSLANTHGWAKAGLMIRESLAANSRHAFMCVSAMNGTAFQRRTVTGGSSSSGAGFAGSALPRWLRLKRAGGTLTGYESSDGANWTQVGSFVLDLPPSVYVGLAVTSHNDGVLCRTTFDSLSVSGGSSEPAPQPPPADTTGWLAADIGPVGVIGSNDTTSGSITVRGSGSDVWDNVDAFRFVYRALTGDGTVEAQVSSQTNTHAWAKAGVMIRDSLAANAANVFAFITPANGIAVQSRTLNGGPTVSRAGTWWVAAPYWLRLVRTGSRIAAYESANGTNWTLVTTFDVPFGSTVQVGLAVTSHDNSQLGTAVFGNPAVR